MPAALALIATLALSLTALAQPLFSSQEIAAHKARIDVITDTAARCLDDTYAEHVRFYKRWNVSKFYGDRRPDYQNREGLLRALAQYGAPASLVDELEPISCIGLTLRCLGQGFTAAGLGSTWTKIHGRLAEGQKFYGTDLQKMLRELGWKTLYWNPDPSQNQAWDEEDRRINPLKPGQSWNPVWGGHAYRYSLVLKNSDYYGIPIDDVATLVGFRSSVPDSFRRAVFFVGTAHAGYHVFPGRRGQVIEAHSMRNLDAFDNLEVSPFNPLLTGGGPRWTRTEKYRSGVIVIPPR